MKEKAKSIQEKLFDFSIDQESPIVKDYARKVNVDSEGNEFITWEEVDYPKLQQSLGIWNDWSLTSLLKAGVNPNFPIHTGNPTRLEGFDTLTAFEDMADEVLAEINIPANEE